MSLKTSLVVGICHEVYVLIFHAEKLQEVFYVGVNYDQEVELFFERRDVYVKLT